MRQLDDLRLEISVRADREQAYRYRELEAAGAAGAGVEVEDAAFVGDAGDMGMAVEDGGESSGGRVEVEGVEVVERVDVAVGNEDDFGFREFAAGTFAVDVTADRGYGGDFAQVIENGDFAYVAEVEDARDAGEGGKDFGAE